MGYKITGPNYVAPDPPENDELDTTQRASLKTHIQNWIGLDGQEDSQAAIKEGKQYARQTWDLKLKNRDVDVICREIAIEWASQ